MYLLFYNKFDYVLTTTYNPKIAIGTFTNTVHTYGNSKGLRQKLNGQQLDLEVQQIPATYGLHDKQSIIFLVVAHITTEKITFLPDHQQMIVNYKIKKDNVITKSGSIALSDINTSYEPKFLQSLKKVTKAYADQYDENTAILTRQFVDKLLLEL